MASLNFTHVVSKKDQKDYIKGVEKSLSENKTFIDSEIKTLQELKTTFPSFKKLESSSGQELTTRRTTFTGGRKKLGESLDNLHKWKDNLDSEVEEHTSNFEDVKSRLKESTETFTEQV